MSDEQSKSKKELIIEFEYLEQQIKLASENLDEFDKQVLKISETLSAIDELSKKDSDTLIPIMDGIYVPAQIPKLRKVTLDIGADVAVTKNIEQAKDILQKQLSTAQDYQQKLVRRLELFSLRADELQEQMRKV